MGRDALWRRVVEEKYGNQWGGWCTKFVLGLYGVNLQKFITIDWLNFSRLLQYEVGVGVKSEILEGCVVWGLYSNGGIPRILLYQLSKGVFRCGGYVFL